MHKATMSAMAAGLALSAGVALAASSGDYGPLKIQDTKIGTVLADANDMTLYTYDEDNPGVSSCYGECAKYWPPAMAEAGAMEAGELSLVKRTDGRMQWAAKGMPLYSYVGDRKPGDVTGDKKNGVWHVAHPE
jgi:predicted lipoprotein with Yx(FWY)xxD motif